MQHGSHYQAHSIITIITIVIVRETETILLFILGTLLLGTYLANYL